MYMGGRAGEGVRHANNLDLARLGRNAAVDWARLGLALSVVVFHFRDMFGVKFSAVFAVPAFLAISGYYVLQSYERSASWREFAIKRVRRIAPALVVSFALVFWGSGLTSLSETVRFYLTMGLIPANGNPALWSLGLEEVVYVFLAVIFTLGAYRAKWPIWIMLVASIVVAISEYGMRTAPLPAFFAGSLCYIYRARLSNPLVGMVILGAGVILSQSWPCPVWFRPIWAHHLTSLTGAVIGVGVLIASKGIRLPKIPDVSYGIYVYHWPFHTLALVLVPGIPALAYLSGLFAFCILSWYLVEKPLLHAKPTLWSRRAEPGLLDSSSPRQGSAELPCAS